MKTGLGFAAMVLTSTLAQAALVPSGGKATLEPVAQFAHQVTGVSVSERDRIFVNFPRWTEDSPV